MGESQAEGRQGDLRDPAGIAAEATQAYRAWRNRRREQADRREGTVCKRSGATSRCLAGTCRSSVAQGHQGVAAAHDGLQAMFTSRLASARNWILEDRHRERRRRWTKSNPRVFRPGSTSCASTTARPTSTACWSRAWPPPSDSISALRSADRNRLSVAGMLHDVGKAMVPVAILEKPRALDPDEMAIMKKHPEYGVQALKCGVGLQPELIDIVAIITNILMDRVSARPAGGRDRRSRAHHDHRRYLQRPGREACL